MTKSPGRTIPESPCTASAGVASCFHKACSFRQPHRQGTVERIAGGDGVYGLHRVGGNRLGPGPVLLQDEGTPFAQGDHYAPHSVREELAGGLLGLFRRLYRDSRKLLGFHFVRRQVRDLGQDGLIDWPCRRRIQDDGRAHFGRDVDGTGHGLEGDFQLQHQDIGLGDAVAHGVDVVDAAPHVRARHDDDAVLAGPVDGDGGNARRGLAVPQDARGVDAGRLEARDLLVAELIDAKPAHHGHAGT